jgi:hypothetical protein
VKGFNMNSRIIYVITILLITSLILLACQDETPETSVVGRCGDGICDDVEKANPNLCPVDCRPETEGDAGGLTGGSSSVSDSGSDDESQENEEEKQPQEWVEESLCELEEWLLTISGCGNEVGTEPAWDICIVFDACIEVDRNCGLSGTGNGKYKTCSYYSPDNVCSYEVSCSNFEMPVSGNVLFFEEGSVLPYGETAESGGVDLFQIKLDASGVWETGKAHCSEVTVELQNASATQVIFGSAHRNGDGYFCEIEVPRPVDEDFYGVKVDGFDALLKGLTYSFNVIMYPGCNRSTTW